MFEIQNVSKVFHRDGQEALAVLQNLSMRIEEGEFVCILGPSGAGKTTLLNIISGLEKDYSGRIHYHRQDNEIIASHLVIGEVFQEPRLLPWKNVYDNIQLVLLDKSWQSQRIEEEIQAFLKMMNLWEFRHYYPGQLSGGMQQRVALIRAFIIKPQLLLMDEPFSNLDEQLKQRLSEELLKLWKLSKKTILFVTHNILEALALGDRVLYLNGTAGFIREWKLDLPRPRSIRKQRFYQIYLQVIDELENAPKLENIDSGVLL